MLVVANAFWGLSFPLIKAIALTHQRVLPASGGMLITACLLAPRFLLATAILVLWLRGRGVGRLTPLELRQGAILAGFTTIGMIFQNDGLQYTSASTSAFLTQMYAIMIPVWVALRRRRLPPAVVWVSCALVLAGASILARFDWGALRFGRGEVETLVSSVFFMGQILALDRPEFARNRPLAVTLVMFSVESAVSVAVLAGVMAAGDGARWTDLSALATSVPWLAFTVALSVFCTVGAFVLMNTWQPRITATEAGLVYCLEPLFASCFALFLPGILSAWAGLGYANETLTLNLLAGGGLITAANVLIQVRPLPKPPPPAGEPSPDPVSIAG